MATDLSTLYERPTELLQHLLRFDTTNPPGNESECIGYIDRLLTSAGLETSILAKDPKRPNLMTRLAGQGSAPPLLLYGHVDVVPTANQRWTHPPFSGELADGYVWGRGALDMKGGVAMMLAALLRAKAEGLTPAGDLVLAIVSDEEGGGDDGAKFLVENHSEHFADIRYAIGEFGGFPIYVGQKKFYAIQVAEKQVCWLKAAIHGPGGHGSMPMRGGTMARLAAMLQKLDESRLPVHVTPVVRQMLEMMADAVANPIKSALTQLLNPNTTDQVLDGLGQLGLMFEPFLHNTVNATMVRGGEKINVIPSQVEVELDGRLLPGYGPSDLLDELQALIGEDIELEVLRHDPGPADPDMEMFSTLADILGEVDPGGIAVPLLLVASSDARHFSRLNIQTYGFIPMNLPEGFNFSQHIHSADERIPAESLTFGTDAIYRALQRYGES